MIVVAMGILDILAALNLFGLQFSIAVSIAWFFFFYLLVKSILFIRDISSAVDLVVAALFLLAILGHYNVVTSLGVLWLLQKGIFSLI